MKQIIKRLFGILLSLALMLGLMVGMSVTAYAAEYNLWVGSEQVTDDNLSGFGWSYNPKNDTLTLSENISGDISGNYSVHNAVIYAEKNLIIDVSQDCTVTGPGPDATNSDTGESSGIYVTLEHDLTIKGNGKLTVTGGTAKEQSCGVHAKKITVNGTLTATGGTARTDSTGSTAGINSYGVYAGDNVTVNGTLTATGGNAQANSFGVYALGHTVTIAEGSTMKATSGDAETNSYGVYTTDITVDGTMTATGGTAGTDSDGVYANGNMTVNGTLTATGGTSNTNKSHGVVCGSDTILTVNGTLIATGGEANNNSTGDSQGVNAGDVAVNGTLIATGGTAGHDSYGVNSSDITVNGTLNATGSTAGRFSYGVSSFSTSYAITVNANAELMARGYQKAINGKVKNKITGIGWTNIEGTKGQATIPINPDPGQTFDYKKVQFPATAKVTKEPKPNTLSYTGSAQELVTAGSAEGGTMQYALGQDATTAPTSGWSTSIPTGTNPGTYYVWYKAVGDKNHLDSSPACVTVTISDNKTTYVAALVDNAVHEIGDLKDCRITVRSEPDSSKAYDNYQNTRMDAEVMPNGSHTAEKGSLILTLKASYLDTLAIGKHKVTINFKDGSVDVDITVKEGAGIPKTGDNANPVLWIGLIVLGLVTAGVILILAKRRK